MMMRPRSNSDEDHLAAAINCLSAWRSAATQKGRIEVRSALSAIRPRLAAMPLPDGLLASVDAAIGQDLEDQWASPPARPQQEFRFGSE